MKIGSEALLEVRGLGKEFAQRRTFSRTRFAVRAFEDVNLTIRRGTTLALVGESGAGKSTLARCLALLEKPTRGEIRFEGANLPALRKRELFSVRRKIQMIFQDPTSALNPGMSAAEIIMEPLVIQRIGTKEGRQARALELMESVALPAASASKGPLEFSGGQRQRLAIARALALEPSLLILDEACSGLDLRSQELILELLGRLQRTLGMTFLYVSHDLRSVAEFADEIAVMKDGRIVEQKPAAELFENPEHAYTRELLAAMPSMETICAGRLTEAAL
ncbi:MAG TPA: ATP-binding cassette domain-containing protein [Candidatus Acidoferrum sp.]|nr:ATP-binding cassette domain-containing protein [Candidatus Acidoferrum sp.]